MTVNNDDSDYTMTVSAGNAAEYIGALSGEKVSVNGGRITVNVKANSGEIWVPAAVDAGFTGLDVKDAAAEVKQAEKKAAVEEAREKDAGTKAVPEITSEKDAQQQKTASEKAASEKKTEAKAIQVNESDKKEGAENTQVQKTADQASEQKKPAATDGNVSGADAAYMEAFEKGKIAGLQEAILAIMGKNGPITDQMRKDVMDNVYHDSLINWIKSFRVS